MSTLFNHAMRYEWAEKNPIRLVRQSAKRERTPDVLTAEEIRALLGKLEGPYYVMAFLAAVTGLRVSELLALKWEDVDFAAGEMSLSRTTENSSLAETRSDGCGTVCRYCCWTGADAALTIKNRITCSHRLQWTALNRSGPQARCQTTSDPLRSWPES